MREIKFRAFWYEDKITTSVDTLEFLNGGLRVSDGCSHQGWNGKDCELMQCTELKDRSNIEIYEGDILAGEPHMHLMEVVWHKACWCVRFYNFGKSYIEPLENAEDNIFEQFDVAVIGDIWANPDLLEEAKKE